MIDKVIIISGPSGVGKTTICNLVKDKNSEIDYIISSTSRPKRNEEKNHINYSFLTKDEFSRKIKKDHFLEWANVFGHLYGTPKDSVINSLKNNRIPLMDIDIQGAKKIKKIFPDTITIFILPPDINTLNKRLLKRGSENKESFENRLKNALYEIKNIKEYTYFVKNINLTNTVSTILSIIKAEKAKVNLKIEKEIQIWLKKVIE